MNTLLLSSVYSVTVFSICYITFRRGILKKPLMLLLVSMGLAIALDIELISLKLLRLAGILILSSPAPYALVFFNRASLLLGSLLESSGLAWLLIIVVRVYSARQKHDRSGGDPTTTQK